MPRRHRHTQQLVEQSPFLEAVMVEGGDIGSTMVLLCLVYFVTTVHAASQLRKQKRKNTMAVFLLSVTTACALRCMCFAGFCLLDLSEVSIAADSVVSRELDSYARAVATLFDLPDFTLISSYVLLLVVWAECFVGARRHWLASRQYKHDWHVAALIFNVILYGTQLALYSAMFLGLDVARLVYLVPALATFAVPVAHFLLYVSLSLTFAGFPMVSPAAKHRLARVSRLTLTWTLGRLLWATAVLTDLFKRAVVAAGGKNPTKNKRSKPRGGAIVALFFLTEICPFILTLDSGLLDALEDRPSEQQLLEYPPARRRRQQLTQLPETTTPKRRQQENPDEADSLLGGADADRRRRHTHSGGGGGENDDDDPLARRASGPPSHSPGTLSRFSPLRRLAFWRRRGPDEKTDPEEEEEENRAADSPSGADPGELGRLAPPAL